MLVYSHVLKTGHLDEVEEAVLKYESLGWIFVELLPNDNTLPTEIIFKWPFNSTPRYPLF